MRSWQTFLAATTLLSLAAAVFPTPSPATKTPVSQSNPSLISEQPGLQDKRRYQLAQTLPSCRQVSTSGGDLIVRSLPNGRITGSLPNGARVTVLTIDRDGWAFVLSPQDGYVVTKNLKSCEERVPEPVSLANNCRQVAATSGTRVRESASISAPIIGRLANRERVAIANRGANGWVAISSPVKGYVLAAELKYCS